MSETKRICIVTGGTKGMGRTLCEEFQNKGYIVVAFDISPLQPMRDGIHSIAVDVSNEDDVNKAFNEVITTIGKPHVIVNNAAISKFNIEFTQMTADQFDSVINVNLRGAFLCCKAFVLANKGENYGRIINIASTRWNQNQSGWEAYGSSKGGLVSLSNTLCVSLSNTPITVNTISPGWIQVDNYDTDLIPDDHAFHPSQRVGKPQDIANACIFMADESNGFINGANLVIDGGVTKKMIYNHNFDNQE